MKINKTIIFFNIIIPIYLGASIYLLFRATNLNVFTWIHYARADDIFFTFRNASADLINILPSGVLYSLPDGLWVYALTFAMCLIWLNDKNLIKYIFLAIGPSAGILGEIGQYFHIVPGTFDIIDLLICGLASLLPFLILNKSRKEVISF